MKSNALWQLCLSALVTLAAAGVSHAQLPVTVLPGYDLFTTTTGTSFQGVTYVGDPLGTYNFGSGVVNVGTTDTIVQRLQTVNLPVLGSFGTTNIQMDALQLMSVGVSPQLFITLQPTVASTGSMTITLTSATPTTHGGTFNSTINVNYEVHSGSLTGPIVASGVIALSSTGCQWSNIAPPNTVLVTGVNHFLDGRDDLDDFFITGACTEAHSGQAGEHAVVNATCPTGGTGSSASNKSGAIAKPVCIAQPD
jgi:hypothetical protein